MNTYRCRFGVDTEIVAGGCPDSAAAQPAPTADAEPQPQWEDDGCPTGWSLDPYSNCKAPDAGAGGFGESADTTGGTTPDGSSAGADSRRFTSSVTASPSDHVSPNFNIYNNVKLHYGIGSERDFLRLGTKGELGNSLEACQDGQVIDLWFYVHNGTATNMNVWDYTGPGVAKGTTVKLNVDENVVGRSHSVVGSIDSNQTDPITNGVTISCANKDIKLKYKGVSYFGTPAPVAPLNSGYGSYELQGDISKGALLGYTIVYGDGTTGVVPGCWDYRARINVQLEVEVL